LRVRHRDGSWRWIEATVANLLDDPAVRSIVANYRDVTDRRASETALRESEQRFREMAEHIREAFFVLDTATGTPLYVSPTWSEIWARPIEEGYDQHTWIGSLHPDDQAEMHNVIARNIAGEPTDHVFRVMRPDGSPRWVRGRAFPVRNEQGEVYRVVGVAKDITELREVEQRFTEAQKLEAVARLAGGVAHDFNNLLTVILAEAEMIRDSLKPASDENKLMGELLAAAQSAATLTRQLLAFSRRQLVEPTVFSINDAVDKTNKMLRRVIGEDISLSTVLAPNAGSVRMDAGHFEQVLTNLAVNARDAMPNGGSLEIRTQQIVVTARGPNAQSGVDAGHYALVSVTDSGIGMSQETLSRVFEPFFTTKERGKGTGLGLATCHGITKQAGGHIFARSAPGKGTTIDVYLPFVAPEAVESAAPEPIAPRGTESILLVEDDDAVRRVATRMLRGQGYTVTDAPTAAAALRCILQAPLPPELLLTDVVLPGMGGRELAERVRAVLPSVKVLFMTGYSDDSVLREQLAAHDASLLRKPYTTTSLAIRVRELLDAPVRHAPGLRAG
jgi:two-component system cell cycle sensor histidine kinase/response regulator CckA